MASSSPLARSKFPPPLWEGKNLPSTAQVAKKKLLCPYLPPALGDQTVHSAKVCQLNALCPPLNPEREVVGDRHWPDAVSA